MILSFSITSKLARKEGVKDPLLSGIKTVTRRLWKPVTANKYKQIFQERKLVHAWNNAPYVPGSQHIADLLLTCEPYQEKLVDMPESDLLLEGGFWDSKDEFIRCVCGNRLNADQVVVWVCRFRIQQEE